jgi:hypothetical protein
MLPCILFFQYLISLLTICLTALRAGSVGPIHGCIPGTLSARCTPRVSAMGAPSLASRIEGALPLLSTPTLLHSP